MILRNLTNRSFMYDIGPAIAHIRNIKCLPIQDRRNTSRAHLTLLRSLGIFLKQGIIGLNHALSQRFSQIASMVLIIGFSKCFNDEMAGNLPVIMSTHTISNDKQRTLLLQKLLIFRYDREHTIFVVYTHTANIGASSHI